MVWLGILELTTVTLTAVELTIVVEEGDNSAGCHKGRRKHKGHRASTKGIEIFLCLKNGSCKAKTNAAANLLIYKL